MSRRATPCTALASLTLLLAACSVQDDERGKQPANPPELSTIGGKELGTLTQEEMGTLCREEARRSDPCLERAIALPTELNCSESLAQCRRSEPDMASRVDCSDLDLGPSGSCVTSVDEYLACLDAWTASLSCADAGKLVRTPEVCLPVVSRCKWLASAFYQDGVAPQCAPNSGIDEPPDTNDDIYGFDGCRPLPQRFAVLGDSIPFCAWITDRSACSSQLIAAELERSVAPGLRAEFHAEPGAVTAFLPVQAARVEPGPGHLAVYIWIIGNDLLMRNVDYEGWEASWKQMFDYFTDPERFPDGVTFLLNTQYTPADECHGVAGTRSDITSDLEQLVREVNKRLFLDVAERRPDTVAVDHYPDWLGHGANADIEGCPHCGADNTSWMEDLTHPNIAGHRHIADKWRHVFERMYAPECPGP